MIPRILAWLQRQLPNQCIFCLSNTHTTIPLCHACQSDLPWQHNLTCPFCASSGLQSGPCGQCLQRHSQLDHAWCTWHYQTSMISMLHQLKFGQALLFAKVIGVLMADAWLRSGQPAPEAIIPVPLHRDRLRSRGYNQAAEIGKHLARSLGIPLEPSLVRRSKATRAQATLNATARQRNMRGAFAVIKPIPYQRVAILDDVMTTGATLHELASTLKQSGVLWVEAWAACRAQRHTL